MKAESTIKVEMIGSVGSALIITSHLLHLINIDNVAQSLEYGKKVKLHVVADLVFTRVLMLHQTI